MSFVWDGTAVIEQERTGPAVEHRVITWVHHSGQDRPVAQYEQTSDGSRFHTIVTDMIGHPGRASGRVGNPQLGARKRPCGARSTGRPIPLRFPGQYADDETGLHYNVFRYYDPSTARYVSQDPLGLDPAPNPVAYVPNPHTATDPLGLAPDRRCASYDTQRARIRPYPNTAAGNTASSSGRPRPDYGSWDRKRTETQGGGLTSGLHTFTRNPNLRQEPADDACTDVNDLNANRHLTPDGPGYIKNNHSDALTKYLEDNGMRVDAGWIKGHLHNGELGGGGHAGNLTPLTDRANGAMKNNWETPVKNAAIRIEQLKANPPSERALVEKGFTPAEARNVLRGIDELSVSYKVDVSKDLKFRTRRTGTSGRSAITSRSRPATTKVFRNNTDLQDYLDANPDRKLPELPMIGEKMDTITGKVL